MHQPEEISSYQGYYDIAIHLQIAFQSKNYRFMKMFLQLSGAAHVIRSRTSHRSKKEDMGGYYTVDFREHTAMIC